MGFEVVRRFFTTQVKMILPAFFARCALLEWAIFNHRRIASHTANVDPHSSYATVSLVKLRHFNTKLSRLNLTKAAREAAALKADFRREDQALAAQGRGDEVWARNRRLMGIKEGARGRLVGFGGTRFE